jgi:hypothetical protein
MLSLYLLMQFTKPNFPYLNFSEIDFYYDTFIGDKPINEKEQTAIELSFTPKITKTYTTDFKSENYIEKLNKVIDYLESFKDLTYNRPSKFSLLEPDDCNFVYEETNAIKLSFPASKLKEFTGLNYLNVWISEPKSEDLSILPYNFTGSFLYLIETITDNMQYRTTISGCSALQALSNLCNDEPIFKVDWDEPLGRNSFLHPIEKLKKLGAFELGRMAIKTIYRKRYITDEQCFKYKDNEYRCNDLLGYPLFIDF